MQHNRTEPNVKHFIYFRMCVRLLSLQIPSSVLVPSCIVTWTVDIDMEIIR
jgi:hypothetical protein